MSADKTQAGETFYVSLDAFSALLTVEEALLADSDIDGSSVADEYVTGTGDKVCFMRLYKKFYQRIDRWLAVFVIADNFEGKTKVHFTVSGGRGVFWG